MQVKSQKLKVKIASEKLQVKSKKCSCTIYGAIKY